MKCERFPSSGGQTSTTVPLLDAMEGRFDAFITVDKNLPKQQRVLGRSFGILVLRAKTNRLADLLPLVPMLLAALLDLRPGQARDLGL
jgi:hypothetical protein